MKMMKNSLALATLTGAAALAGGVATADTGTVNATIDVITPVAIRAARALNFGKLTIPSDQDVTWTMVPTSPSLATLSSNGSDSVDVDTGDHEAGRFDVQAEAGQTISLTVSVVDFSAPGLSLTIDENTQMLPSGGSFDMASPLPFPSFEMPIAIGGELTVTTGATAGLNGGGDAATVTVTAAY